jgi:hypothetical protein
LALTNQVPTVEQYEAVLMHAEADRVEYVTTLIAAMMNGPAFEAMLLDWGHEYLALSSYDYDVNGGYWTADDGIDTQRCANGTRHAGAIGILNQYPSKGDPLSICDDQNAALADIEPWWAPGTTVEVIGEAGNGATSANNRQCAIGQTDIRATYRAGQGCGCGPNLVFCSRDNSSPDTNPLGFHDGDLHFDTSQRRAVSEEPARLFTYIIQNDRPFSDLVTGDYTVVNAMVHHMYHRKARLIGQSNAELDHDQWWRSYSGDEDWQERRFEEMHPQIVSDRNVSFDPRLDNGAPVGIPAAGVMTTLTANAANARERVRAARWLEVFACRQFNPPPGDVEFPPYRRDPATEGICKHCHQIIDPAAIHFKRFAQDGGYLGGFGRFSLSALPGQDPDGQRWRAAFSPNTQMTPVTEAQLAANPDARFIDFLPPEQTLFGLTSDGTIGPLGFGKLLVESGEFDRCVVRKTWQRIAGRELTPGRDQRLIEDLTAQFTANEGRLKPLIRHILSHDEFSRGL